MKKTIIALDVGGSSIKAGIIDKRGNILTSFSEKTKKTKIEFLKQINRIIKQFLSFSYENKIKIKKIGIGFAGSINPTTKKIMYSPNLPIKNFNLASYLKKRFSLPVRIENDAHCSAIAEKHFGKSKNLNNFVVLTIGTGIGSAVFINNELYRGGKNNEGLASELGHITIVPNGKICNCGNKGCLEQYASSSALKRFSNNLLGKHYNLTELLHFIKQNKNKEKAIKSITQTASYLGIGIANIVNILNPEAVILSGGIIQDNKNSLFIKETINSFKKHSFPIFSSTPILVSEIKESGMIGAALL